MRAAHRRDFFVPSDEISNSSASSQRSTLVELDVPHWALLLLLPARRRRVRRGGVKIKFEVSEKVHAAAAPAAASPRNDSGRGGWGGRGGRHGHRGGAAAAGSASPAVPVRKSRSIASFSLAAYFRPNLRMRASCAAWPRAIFARLCSRQVLSELGGRAPNDGRRVSTWGVRERCI